MGDGSFHSHDGWHWLRLDSGAVVIEQRTPNGDGSYTVTARHELPAEQWASVVSSVSKGGEVNGRFYTALAFHQGD